MNEHQFEQESLRWRADVGYALFNATANPRPTASRAFIPLYHRCTFGKSARSTLCRSCRQTQPTMAKSAIEISSPAKKGVVGPATARHGTARAA